MSGSPRSASSLALCDARSVASHMKFDYDAPAEPVRQDERKTSLVSAFKSGYPAGISDNRRP
jgi:hypothetical protein